jgi:neutral ceramidase
MRNSRPVRICGYIVLLFATPALVSFGAPRGTLQVGAAKVDITPAPDAALPMAGYAGRAQGFQRIHDHIYARAIVISDGTNQAALLAWELVAMPTHVWEELSQRVGKELGIPPANVIFAAVHDHGAPSLSGNFREPSSPGTIAYTAKVENDAFEAVRQAKANLQPAQFGFGTGMAYVNINIPKKAGGGWATIPTGHPIRRWRFSNLPILPASPLPFSSIILFMQ